MMELTTRIGTAKGTFRDKRGRRLLPVEVAGKTGTLSAETDRGYVGYSWFVGYAPAERPAIAFAVVLGNNPNWRIKATYVGRHIVCANTSPATAHQLPAAPRLLAAQITDDEPIRSCGCCPSAYRLSSASEGETSAACSFTNGSRASRMTAAVPRRSSIATRTCRGAGCSIASIGARRSCTRWASAPGAWVGLMLGNVPDFVILALALSKVEGVVVPLDPTTGNRELEMILEAAPLRALVTRPRGGEGVQAAAGLPYYAAPPVARPPRRARRRSSRPRSAGACRARC